MIVGDSDTLLSCAVESSRQKPTRQMLVLNNTTKQIDLAHINRTSQSNTKECTFFLAPHSLSLKFIT